MHIGEIAVQAVNPPNALVQGGRRPWQVNVNQGIRFV